MVKPRSFAPIIAAVLLLLPLLYVGSYLVLVEPTGLQAAVGNWRLSKQVHYRIGTHPWAEIIFWPLEQIDRRVRPGAWHDVSPVVG